MAQGSTKGVPIDTDSTLATDSDALVPSQKAIKSYVDSGLSTKSDNSTTVHNTGNESIGGVKTFTSDPIIPDEAYGVSWNGSLEPPTKNAVYDKIETLGGSGTVTDFVFTDGGGFDGTVTTSFWGCVS